jgi:predicted ATPase/class 3 adenylate cyclase
LTDLPTGTLTFLFTDIEGSTRLLQRLGARYPDVLEEHRRVIRAALADHDGHEVATHGDSFFVVFGAASDAVAAVSQAQRSLATHDWPHGTAVSVRMGLHTGEAGVVDGTYVGLDVHRAARIGAAASGGQVLLSRACTELVEGSLPLGVSIRDMGDHRLKDLSRPERLHQLVIDGLRSDFPPIRSADPTLDNLPVQLTSFIGRERESTEIADLLVSSRLLTLRGPGGTGKTRLAAEVAGRVGGRFADGVRFVPLAPVTDPALVPSAVGQALEILEAGRGSEPVASRVADFLRQKEMLLVVDNFEQLIPAAGVLADLLRAAPRVRMLVTSRTVLGIAGEHVYRVPPLGLPDPSGPMSPDALAAFEAVSLFVQRAAAVRPGFAVTPENAPAIAEICIRLDGLPLAIELAASRVRILSPQAIVSRLGDRLRLLQHEGGDAPTRHRALRDTIDWSHELLEASERRLFARLAVFNGGGTLADIAAVVEGASEPLGVDVLDGLTSLTDKSLLSATEDEEGEPRFGMLRTIREFASERLTAGGEEPEIRDRHLDVFLALAEEAEPHLLEAQRRARLDRLEREIDNFRAALRWSTDASRVEHALRLGAALWRLWQMRGYLREARSQIERVLALDGVHRYPRQLARALEAAGGIAHWQGDSAAERSWYERAVAIARELGDRRMLANGLFNLSYAYLPYDLATDDPSVPDGLLHEARSIFEELEDTVGVARTYEARAAQAFFRHEWVAAAALAREGATRLRPLGDTHYLGWSVDLIGYSALQLGDLETARASLREALALTGAPRDLSGIALVLDQLAALVLREGDLHGAMRLAGAASELSASTGADVASRVRSIPHYGTPDGAVLRANSRELEAAWDDGRSMTVDEAVAYALERHSAAAATA